MKARYNLPHNCGMCDNKILKKQEYLYREKKSYPNGFLYFHKECYGGGG